MLVYDIGTINMNGSSLKKVGFAKSLFLALLQWVVNLEAAFEIFSICFALVSKIPHDRYIKESQLIKSSYRRLKYINFLITSIVHIFLAAQNGLLEIS